MANEDAFAASRAKRRERFAEMMGEAPAAQETVIADPAPVDDSPEPTPEPASQPTLPEPTAEAPMPTPPAAEQPAPAAESTPKTEPSAAASQTDEKAQPEEKPPVARSIVEIANLPDSELTPAERAALAHVRGQAQADYQNDERKRAMYLRLERARVDGEFEAVSLDALKEMGPSPGECHLGAKGPGCGASEHAYQVRAGVSECHAGESQRQHGSPAERRGCLVQRWRSERDSGDCRRHGAAGEGAWR